MSGVGRLSEDPVTNLRYHFVVTAALITRICAAGGMPMEEAYSLSDFYIQKMDRCRSETEIILLHDQMAMDYTGRMMARKKNTASSRPVIDTIDYVYAHLLERITVEDLARAVNISPTYLSRVFKNEMGVSISDYIRRRKIEAAENFLRYSDWSLVEIANKLS